MAYVSLTRAEAKTLAKTLLDEKGSLFWTDAQANILFDEANRMVWREIIKANPAYYLKAKEFTWPADTEHQDIVSDMGVEAVPYKIYGVEHKDSAGNVTQDNLPTKWKPMQFQDRSKYLQDASPYWTPRARHYCLRGSTFFVAPIPGEALKCEIYYVLPLTKVASDGTQCLDGSADSFHDAVAYALAWLMNAKQNGQNPTVTMLWENAKLAISQHAEDLQVDEPRQVRFLGHY